jgi:hypothetical protein
VCAFQDGEVGGDYKLLTPEELLTNDVDMLRGMILERREEDGGRSRPIPMAGPATVCEALAVVQAAATEAQTQAQAAAAALTSAGISSIAAAASLPHLPSTSAATAAAAATPAVEKSSKASERRRERSQADKEKADKHGKDKDKERDKEKDTDKGDAGTSGVKAEPVNGTGGPVPMEEDAPGVASTSQVGQL